MLINKQKAEFKIFDNIFISYKQIYSCTVIWETKFISEIHSIILKLLPFLLSSFTYFDLY